MEALIRYQQARRVTIIGAIANFVLAVIKVVGGILGHSHALVADGIHSFSDLLSDALVLITARYSSRSADPDHPYGHARIETMATVGLAQLLILAGSVIVYDAGSHIFFQSSNISKPSCYVLGITIISVVVNEALFHLILHTAKRLKSKLLQAHAWHQRSDALASLVVLAGICGAWSGWPYCDAIAALIVGLLIIKMGVELGWSSIRELIDTGLDELTVQALYQQIKAIAGVKAVHQLRTRSMAGAIMLDVHIQVAPHISVSEGHFIAQQVHFKLLEEKLDIHDVTVHVDPEDDEIAAPSRHLPAREQLLPLLMQAWQNLPGSEEMQGLILHYLNGKLTIEINLPVHIITPELSLQELQARYLAAVKSMADIDTVKIFLYA